MNGVRGAICVAIFLVARTATASDLELRFLDVGQGDAALIRNDGKAVLVDTGPSDQIVDALRALGVRSLDLLIISHNHADHLGGADAVLTQMKVRQFMDNGYPTKSKLEAVVLALVDARHVGHLEATRRAVPLGDATLHVIPPAEGVGGDDQNNTSVGVIVERGKFKALLTGDSEVEEINSWLAAGIVPTVDVLKAAHHGSRNGLTPLWLHRTQAKVVVISVGANNRYGHPDPMALRYYQTGGRRLFRTDQNGDVVVQVNKDGTYRVATQRQGPPVVAANPPKPAVTSPSRCCRVCRKGKACGNGCIPQGKACAAPPGCACQGKGSAPSAVALPDAPRRGLR